MFSHNLEDRIKRLEEDIAYCHKDIANLCNIIENLQEPEYHTHEYHDMRTCSDCKQKNLEDFI